MVIEIGVLNSIFRNKYERLSSQSCPKKLIKYAYGQYFSNWAKCDGLNIIETRGKSQKGKTYTTWCQTADCLCKAYFNPFNPGYSFETWVGMNFDLLQLYEFKTNIFWLLIG